MQVHREPEKQPLRSRRVLCVVCSYKRVVFWSLYYLVSFN